MEEREFERLFERLIRQDFSAGTDAFREALLKRCLAELDADNESFEIPDEDLELLAAAGNLDAAVSKTRSLLDE